MTQSNWKMLFTRRASFDTSLIAGRNSSQSDATSAATGVVAAMRARQDVFRIGALSAPRLHAIHPLLHYCWGGS